MEIYHQYVRLRRHFGRYPHFVDAGADMLADVRPNEEHAADCVPRNPMLSVVQCVPEMSEHDANTTAVLYASKAVAHVEGGWPKDVDCTEAEHTIRYRKKAEKDEEYIRTVVQLGASVESLIKQNNAIDIYEQYFAGLAPDHGGAAPSARTLTVLRDPCAVRRPVSSVSWHPDASKVVLSHALLAFQQQPAGMPLESHVWDVSRPTEPEAVLCGPSPLVVSRFNVKDANLVGSGQYNGQFVLFDTRRGSAPAEATPMDVCHRDPVYDVAWLQSKTGSEAMTVSTDGSVLWWDIRKLSDAVESMPLREKGSDAVLAGVCLEYDPAAGATKFMVGCENGAVLSCNRRAKNPADRVSGAFIGHHGAVYGLQRHPCFPKFFMSVGDWTVRLWSEDLRSPLLVSPHASAYLTGGAWSPSRPGLLFTTQSDGSLNAWDLFLRHSEPSLRVQVSDHSLTALAAAEAGGMLACGTHDGDCAILALSECLVEASQNEKQGIGAMLEREALREKNFEKAQKEAKAKARKEAARHAELADNVTDEDLAAVEDTFARETGIISSSGDDSWRLLEARRAAVEAAAVAAAAVAAHADAQDALGGGRDSGCGAALMSSSRASVAVGGAAGDGG